MWIQIFKPCLFTVILVSFVYLCPHELFWFKSHILWSVREFILEKSPSSTSSSFSEDQFTQSFNYHHTYFLVRQISHTFYTQEDYWLNPVFTWFNFPLLGFCCTVHMPWSGIRLTVKMPWSGIRLTAQMPQSGTLVYSMYALEWVGSCSTMHVYWSGIPFHCAHVLE